MFSVVFIVVSPVYMGTIYRSMAHGKSRDSPIALIANCETRGRDKVGKLRPGRLARVLLQVFRGGLPRDASPCA